MTSLPSNNSSNVFMVFGQTGNGKSTLIKLFCGDNAPSSIIGHSTESKTKDTSFFNELDNNNKLKRIWIDTMGTSDSSDNISNEDILRKVMAKMYTTYSSGFNVKVIWVVKKDCRASKDLKIESTFINSLSEYSNSSIWDSTIIIVKEGRFQPKKNVKGALAAAAQFYNKTIIDKDNNKLADLNSIGYTMLSALDKDDEILEDIEDGEISDKARLKQGYLYDNEIKKEISTLLDSKSFINVTFRKDTCLKCGITGDSRFVPTKCHLQFERKHGITLGDDDDSEDEFKVEYIHTGEKKWRHKDGEILIQKHTEYIGYKSHKSSSTYEQSCGQEVSGYSKKKICPKGHDNLSDRRIVTSGEYHCSNCYEKPPDTASVFGIIVKSLNLKGWLVKGHHFYRCYGCSSSGEIICESRCIREVDDKPIFKTRYRTLHSCCNQVYYSDNYCKPEWVCCGKDSSHPGCTKIWSSCQKDENNKGCEEYWTCCDEPVKGGKPCKYACCKQDKDSRGCKKVCKQCGILYGKGPGCCTENVKHRFKKN